MYFLLITKKSSFFTLLPHLCLSTFKPGQSTSLGARGVAQSRQLLLLGQKRLAATSQSSRVTLREAVVSLVSITFTPSSPFWRTASPDIAADARDFRARLPDPASPWRR